MEDVGVSLVGDFIYETACQDDPDDNTGGNGGNGGGSAIICPPFCSGPVGLGSLASLANIDDLSDNTMLLDMEVATQESDLQTKVDNGNTELLRSDIQMANTENYTEVVEEMQATDAYISDEVAIEFMEKDVDRPVAKTVALIANSPLPEKAKQKIDNLNLTDNLKNLLKSYQTGLSNRELKEADIQNLKHNKQKLLKLSYKQILSDTTINDSVRTQQLYTYADILAEQGEWQNRIKATQLMLKSGRLNDALVQVAELRQDLYSLDEAYAEHAEQYLNLLALKAQLYPLSQAERKALIIQNKEWIENLSIAHFADGKTETVLLLEEAELREYVANVMLPLPENRNRTAMAKSIQTKFDFSTEQDIIEVYPNPVSDILTVEFLMFNGQVVDNLGIYDLNGKLLQTHPIKRLMDWKK
jgi:hypothetical protein